MDEDVQARHDFVTGVVAAMFAAGTPDPVINRFLSECERHPGERPVVTRDFCEEYPDVQPWIAHVRCFSPTIFHWEWADGSGFPPTPAERHAERVQTRRLRAAMRDG